MFAAAINLWLLPATLFFDAFSPKGQPRSLTAYFLPTNALTSDAVLRPLKHAPSIKP